MTSKWYERLGVVCLLLLVAQAVLVILSWLLSATMTEGVRSLLSSEGIRWFFGGFSAMVASPLLGWLLLMLIALGCLQKCGISVRSEGYRHRIALRVSVAFLLIYAAIIALLTLMPHAILLSATGELFPSAFSSSLVPVVAFGIIVFSVAYGQISGRFTSLGDILSSLSFGIQQGAPWLVVYILAAQLCYSFMFVFA